MEQKKCGHLGGGELKDSQRAQKSPMLLLPKIGGLRKLNSLVSELVNGPVSGGG